MTDTALLIHSGSGSRTVRLSSYLEPAAEEQAHHRTYVWIKSLRHAAVDGEPFRDRFRVRGDSLWWFTELYLHKTQVMLDVHRTLAATLAVIERERPREITVTAGDVVSRHVVPLVAAMRQVRCTAHAGERLWWRRMASLDLRARRLTLAAHVAPDRMRRASVPAGRPDVAAFIHRAFWRSDGDDGTAESYVGPVLAELERELSPQGVRYVGVGPRTNFRERRSWSLAAGGSSQVIPIERFAPMSALRQSRAISRARYGFFRALTRSAAVRAASVVDDVDCWPVVREQLAGVAWLQWPWSVRAMDEAAAALDALRPSGVLTYAEAGGWGRALILEARRRQIPSAGLQHGFIYRHWLNYLHEPDEMGADARTGFPRPTVTLVFDEYARAHLQTAGRFPAGAVQVTGSPRLDALVSSIRSLPPAAVDGVRRDARLQEGDALVLVATKEREAREHLPVLVAAAREVPGAVLVIKPHPAETAESYAWLGHHPHVRMAAPATPLAPLLAAARAVVTVNSTVAIDAGLLDVPALTIGLPNNLSPFVDAGAIAGTPRAAELPELLRRILYDEGFRQQLAEQRRVVLGRSAIASDGHAAARTAGAVCRLIQARAPAEAD